VSGPIVITGGGTGGHVYPMQAIAQALVGQGVDSQRLRFVGSRRGQEATLLANGAVPLTLLPGRGLRRSMTPKDLARNLAATIGLAAAMGIAFARVGKWRPSVVVSVGGYASFATSLAAVLWRRPLVLVESDATPGLSQRVLARFATRRCTALASSGPNSIVTGAPLRDAILAIDRSPVSMRAARANAIPPIEDGRSVVVVMTGSLGATSVNLAVLELATLWSSRHDRTVIHVTGRRDFASIGARRPETKALDYRVVEFGDMAELWALCDVALCRSGAITVAELTALGIASVLVPLPGAPGDHQSANARALANAHGALVIADDRCSAQSLAMALDEILEPSTLDSMSAAAHSLGHRDAASAIARVVLDVEGSP
jgi:UDP-N-acetylglucosamine--N-acetylmuramyl-(pentapeptide) pyrophosphoryl-undecaprenol N-acetylglucosamine transferase